MTTAEPPVVEPAAPAAGPSLLARAGTPQGLRALRSDELAQLASEIRSLLVDTVCAAGGHLGAGLGVVELTIALHRVFDSPRDAILFDTGHQSYPHKVLTGRAEDFGTLRKSGGLSGYPSRSESEHDWIENSHASTALAYADGLAKASHHSGDAGRKVVAVVGDGALTGGLAFEALNNIGAAHHRPVVVVLNDNARSYDPTTGALAAHLALLRGGSGTARRRNAFTDLGFAYLGPVDGHDTPAVEAALRRAAALDRPVVVHAVTAKGHGYGPAEADTDDRMHACGVVDPVTGRPVTAAKPSWTSVFGEETAALGNEREDIVALTSAMRLPVGPGSFSAAFPDRVFDSGIAEQHAVASAAGLAMGGLHPVVCLYATFLNRAYDQVLMDVALHRLPVTFVLDRAGITGPDGPSHHGMWDLAMLAHVPGLKLATPRDPARLRVLLREAVEIHDGPTALRFPKATAGADLDALVTMDGLDILHRGSRTPPGRPSPGRPSPGRPSHFDRNRRGRLPGRSPRPGGTRDRCHRCRSPLGHPGQPRPCPPGQSAPPGPVRRGRYQRGRYRHSDRPPLHRSGCGHPRPRAGPAGPVPGPWRTRRPAGRRRYQRSGPR